MNILAEYFSCGGGIITKAARIFPKLVSTAVTLIKVGVPVILIILGMLDLGKAVVAQKEDEIKKAQTLFLKRLLAGALVFFVFFIVQLVFEIIGDTEDKNDKKNIWSCVDCFVNNNGSCAAVK